MKGGVGVWDAQTAGELDHQGTVRVWSQHCNEQAGLHLLVQDFQSQHWGTVFLYHTHCVV